MMLRVLLLTLVALTDARVRDVNSGCPCQGCLPTGTFTLSSGVQSSQGNVRWSTEIDTVDPKDAPYYFKGCVSDQAAVVCPTSKGYVSLDPLTGKIQWNYTTQVAPYPPILDIYGDLIGSDTERLYCVHYDGKPEPKINVEVLQAKYNLVLSNNSMLFLTSASTRTNQIVTYGTDGICDASIELRDTIAETNGTFLASSQPIISGARAYVMTQFMPDNMTSHEAHRYVGMQRLYAIDIHNRMLERLTIAWFRNFGESPKYQKQQKKRRLRTLKKNHDHHLKFSSEKHTFSQVKDDDEISPILVFHDGVVYINNPGATLQHRKRSTFSARDVMPVQSTIWAVRDDNNIGFELYRRTGANYGPMAIYDPTEPDVHKTAQSKGEDQVLWVLTRSPGMVSGYSSKNGSFVASMWIADIANMSSGAYVSSVMTITRQGENSTEDVLIMGVVDADREPSVLVVGAGTEADPANRKPRLLWVQKVAASPNKDTFYSLDGQITNFVDMSGDASGSRWLYALVVEHDINGVKPATLYVKGIL